MVNLTSFFRFGKLSPSPFPSPRFPKTKGANPFLRICLLHIYNTFCAGKLADREDNADTQCQQSPEIG